MLKSDPLWYLIQISKCNSMSIAAEMLHISQPSLTVAIKKLEEQLNTKLLNRHYNGVSLTKDGKKVVALAEKGFSYFEQIETIGKYYSVTDLKDVVLYSNPAFAPALIQSFSNYNKVGTNFVQIINTDCYINPPTIIRNNPNIVFFDIIPQAEPVSSEFGTHIFNIGNTFIICASDFPYISATKKSISFKELLDIPLISNRNALYFQNIMFKELKKYGEPNICAEASDIITAQTMLAAGIGFVFTCSLFYNFAFQNSRIIPVRNAPKFCSALVYNRNIDASKLESIIQIVSKNLSNAILL